MAYYNPAYGTYYPQYQQQPVPQQQPVQTQQNGIIWVQGEVGAKSYLVAPNNSVVLWDNENPVIYVKSADPSGMPTMRTFEYKERVNAPPTQSPAPTNDYVSRSEFDALCARLDSLSERMNEKKPPTKKTKEMDDNGKSDV